MTQFTYFWDNVLSKMKKRKAPLGNLELKKTNFMVDLVVKMNILLHIKVLRV